MGLAFLVTSLMIWNPDKLLWTDSPTIISLHSTRHTRDAQLQTWLRFHTTDGLGTRCHQFHLLRMYWVAVSCLFKAGGYKSYRNYLGRAKDFHITSGFPWTDALQRVASRCTRSVLRGLGGPTRSEPFDFLDVVKHLEGVEEPLIENGPIFPQVMVVVGVYFMLRELELSAIDVSDSSFSQNDSVTLNLPVSKTDWMAKGCRRTWSCLCSLGRPWPVHVLSAYVKILSDRGQLGGPLIRTIEGRFCTKQAVVDTIRHAVHAAGGLAKSTSGEWVVSGHTFRVTGARTLHSLGTGPHHGPTFLEGGDLQRFSHTWLRPLWLPSRAALPAKKRDIRTHER